MNLWIQKPLAEFIAWNTYCEIHLIGSRLYGLQNNNSDYDYLIIYDPFRNQIYNPFLNHHQFQYKEFNTDYNFVDICTFIKNLVSGDSPINYEVLHSEGFYSSKYGWLVDYVPWFRTYNIIKGFLGFAERDCRNIAKRDDVQKGARHIVRSFVYAKQIFYKRFSLKSDELNIALALIPEGDTKVIDYVRFLFGEINNFRRTVLNMALENGSLPRTIPFGIQESMADVITTIEPSDKFLDLTKFYEANETPNITYDIKNT